MHGRIGCNFFGLNFAELEACRGPRRSEHPVRSKADTPVACTHTCTGAIPSWLAQQQQVISRKPPNGGLRRDHQFLR